jgi:membrane protein implicated in regulation of membrane protease activity
MLLMIPVGFLLGFHVAFLAMFIRWLTRLPYWIAFVLLYCLLILPLWFFASGNVIVLTIPSLLADPSRERRNGRTPANEGPARQNDADDELNHPF